MEKIYRLFQQSVEHKMQVGEELLPPLQAASELLVQALLSEKKVICCGEGISASLAEIFSQLLLTRENKELPSLPVLNVSIKEGQDGQEVRALGQEGDILLVICEGGVSQSVIQSIASAHERAMKVVVLTGGCVRDAQSMLDTTDIEINVALENVASIHEVHMLCLFVLAELIDSALFGIE